MFNIFNMMGNYEERKVANDEVNGAIIDTCYVSDSEQDYETGITHPEYNDGEWIIVEMYETKELAEEGHKRWVEVFKAGLPKYIRDVSTASIRRFGEILGAFKEDERFYRKDKNNE